MFNGLMNLKGVLKGTDLKPETTSATKGTQNNEYIVNFILFILILHYNFI